MPALQAHIPHQASNKDELCSRISALWMKHFLPAKVILPAAGANVCRSCPTPLLGGGVLGTCDIELLLMYEL